MMLEEAIDQNPEEFYFVDGTKSDLKFFII